MLLSLGSLKIIAMNKKCNICLKEKPKTDFYVNKGCADGYQNRCMDCTKQKSNERLARINSDPALKEKEITIREDAPEGLRGYIKMAYYDLDKSPSDLRAITTRVLRIPPDHNNWSEFPNIDYEVEEHLESCNWYLVYDIIETIIQKLNPQESEIFTEEINEYFKYS